MKLVLFSSSIFSLLFSGLNAYTSTPGQTCGVKNLYTIFGARDRPFKHPLERIVGGDDAEQGQYATKKSKEVPDVQI